MLFNSYVFILAFLPLALLGYFGFGKFNRHGLALSWIVLASLVFYGWHSAGFVWLILLSVVVNYTLAWAMGATAKDVNAKEVPQLRRKILASFGIALNIALIGYYKYAEFFYVNVVNDDVTNSFVANIVLPIGISFYTLQQVAFLVEVYRGNLTQVPFLQYMVFVTFFPQLIAGPIVNYWETVPQFLKKSGSIFNSRNFSIGISIFVLGLFKKVILADTFATYASPVFALAEKGDPITFFKAWNGALSYTFQLYFDFSAYSDMAIGLAKMFNINIPINFNSPYKACNIRDFWRRWHITLTRFLTNYLYISLGGNKKGRLRQLLNIFATMVIGGLWHGAGWTFIVWGSLHGFYICVNHIWRSVWKTVTASFPKNPLPRLFSALLFFIGRQAGWLLTFGAVIFGWVFFRATSLDSALNIVSGMLGHHDKEIVFFLWKQYKFTLYGMLPEFKLTLPYSIEYWDLRIPSLKAHAVSHLFMIICGFILTCFAPNVYEIMKKRWKPNFIWATSIGFIFMLVLMSLYKRSEFLYFQF